MGPIQDQFKRQSEQYILTAGFFMKMLYLHHFYVNREECSICTKMLLVTNKIKHDSFGLNNQDLLTLRIQPQEKGIFMVN